MTPTVAAFDPGLSGALAIISGGDPDFDTVQLHDLPQANGELDPSALARLLRDAAPRRAIIEHVHSMPKQGVASTFKFGRAFGTTIGVVGALGIPLVRVRPAIWKKHFGLINQPKDAARALALRLYPNLQGLHLKKHHGRADALLLARYLIEVNPLT